MKIPIVDLTLTNALQLKERNNWSEHFNVIVWPRILFWLGLKELFSDYKTLCWKIHFTPDNMHNNFVSMHIVDPNETFNFYFQVPLIQKLGFNLYLGDSTYNFFEVHPLLISKNVINKDEYEIKATSTVLPHLNLVTENSRYDKGVLWNINEDNYKEVVKTDPIINLLTANFNRFILPLSKIISNEWSL